MISEVDDTLRAEAERYGFRFTCEECASFDTYRRACSHGYPNKQHLAVDLATSQHVVFCKEFELV